MILSSLLPSVNIRVIVWGTCPKCEAEVRYLEQQLERKRMGWKSHNYIGDICRTGSNGTDDFM